MSEKATSPHSASPSPIDTLKQKIKDCKIRLTDARNELVRLGIDCKCWVARRHQEMASQHNQQVHHTLKLVERLRANKGNEDQLSIFLRILANDARQKQLDGREEVGDVFRKYEVEREALRDVIHGLRGELNVLRNALKEAEDECLRLECF